MTRQQRARSSLIEDAVHSVWADAGLEGPDSGIVPLFDLVASYPIWIAEVENLSIERAAQYLADRTGQMPELGLASRGALSGFFYAYQFRGAFVGCILIEKCDSLVRRRFSVAHELGHYKLHFEPWLAQVGTSEADEGILIADTLIYPDRSDNVAQLTLGDGSALPVRRGEVIPRSQMILSTEMEAEANQFAASFLMPEGILRKRVGNFHLIAGQPRGYLASRLAGEFLVSKDAMMYRLVSLGL